MIKLLNIMRPLIAVLLVFQVSVAYALPEGIHLNFCIGPDGRFEISPDLCENDRPGLASETPERLVSNNSSHDDCLEFELGCLSAGVFRPTTSMQSPAGTKIRKGTANDAGSPIFLVVNRILPLPDQSPRSEIAAETSLSSQISSLRTIILQI